MFNYRCVCLLSKKEKEKENLPLDFEFFIGGESIVILIRVSIKSLKCYKISPDCLFALSITLTNIYAIHKTHLQAS